MTEERIYIKNGPFVIEGLISRVSQKNGVVICHPHSLMGGSMYNNVVETLQEVYSAKNYSTLRFNFRGVGASTGFYDEGRGESKDVRTVCWYLKEEGMRNLFLAGYSFGAWVGSKLLEESSNPFIGSVFVSPPIEYFDFNWVNLTNKVDLIVCGDQDQFCAVNILEQVSRKIKTPLQVVGGADHFYMGKEKELASILQKYIIEPNNKKK